MNKLELLISSNVGVEEIDAIMAIWEVLSLQNHDRYLGIPYLIECFKCNTFKEFKAEFKKRYNI